MRRIWRLEHRNTHGNASAVPPIDYYLPMNDSHASPDLLADKSTRPVASPVRLKG